MENPPNDQLFNNLLSHSMKFDNLMQLIPIQFYVTPNSTLEEEAIDRGIVFKYHKNVKIDGNVKKLAKKRKLDPEEIPRTVMDLTQGNPTGDGSDSEKRPTKRLKLDEVTPINNTSVEELKQRLTQRITQLQQKRNLKDIPRSRDEILKNRLQKKKERREKVLKNREKKSGNTIATTTTTPQDSLAFSNLNSSKLQAKKIDPKHLLEKVKEKTEKLQNLAKENPEKHEEIKESIEWKNALKKSQGIKVHDSVTLLKKKVKRQEKDKEKSKKSWEQRLESQANTQKERQEKRRENIQKYRTKEGKKVALKERQQKRKGQPKSKKKK